MGSPVTSGNPSIDYFVSATRCEPPFLTGEEEGHYSEQLVLMDGVGISYPFPSNLPIKEDITHKQYATFLLTVLKLPRHMLNYTRYTCGQHLFKLQPKFDSVIAGVLKGDVNGVVLLQSSDSEGKTDIVKSRLRKRLGETMYERVVFVPRVTSYEFHLLLQVSDVILHPFPFGGSKTYSDAVASGTPVVVLPTGYLRGRMALGMYYEMGDGDREFEWIYDCCIAGSVEQYVAMATRLGKDEGYRSRVSETIRERAGQIFDNESVLREWGMFLDGVAGVKGEGRADEKMEYEEFNDLVMRDLQRRAATARNEEHDEANY